MPKALIDDDLDAALSRSYRNAGHATGDTPGGHRFRIGRCSPGLSSCSGVVAVEHVATGDGLWVRHDVLAAVRPVATSGGVEAAPHRAAHRTPAPRRTRPGPRRCGQASLRAVRGGKKLDRTLPIAARPGRSIMFSPTRTGFRSSRPDGGEPARRHAAPAPGRRLSNPGGCAGRPATKPQLVQGDRGNELAAPSRPTPAPRHRVRTSPSAARPHGSGLGRTRWVVERTLAWLHRFRRLAVRYERRPASTKPSCPWPASLVCWYYLKPVALISYRALRTRWLLRPRRVHRSE